MEWTYSAKAEITISYEQMYAWMVHKEISELTEDDKKIIENLIAERRVQTIFDKAEHSVNLKEIERKYQEAIFQGLKNTFEDTEKLIKSVRESHLDKKYRGAIKWRIDMLKRLRNKDFLEDHFNKIDEKIKELNILHALIDAYWYNNDVCLPKEFYSMHDYLSKKIRINYTKKNENHKFLDIAIQACEKQISIAKDLSKKVLKGVKQFSLKSIDEIVADCHKESINSYKGIRKPIGFNPIIHKSPDDFVMIPGKLGEHTGYKQLCIIRAKEENWQEVIRLAEQAKSEGWAGDWDKRIEKAQKKLEKI
jgi:hypothetical protein